MMGAVIRSPCAVHIRSRQDDPKHRIPLLVSLLDFGKEPGEQAGQRQE